MSKEKQFRKWHIELVLNEGRKDNIREIWNVELPEGTFIGFEEGWFHIGNSVSINQRIIVEYEIQDFGLTA